MATAMQLAPLQSSDEAALVVDAKHGDGQAFEILMERNQWRILAVARRFTRIRPVVITVGATILALFPLAPESGPLWNPFAVPRSADSPSPPSSPCSWSQSFTGFLSLT